MTEDMKSGGPRFRARIRRNKPMVIDRLDGSSTIVEMGWGFLVSDLDRTPGQQIVLAGTRGSQPEALEQACDYIAARVGGLR